MVAYASKRPTERMASIAQSLKLVILLPWTMILDLGACHHIHYLPPPLTFTYSLLHSDICVLLLSPLPSDFKILMISLMIFLIIHGV